MTPSQLMKTLDRDVTVIDPRSAEVELEEDFKAVRSMEDEAGQRLGLALEQNLDDPLVRACADRYADCRGDEGPRDPAQAPARCSRVLAYTLEGRDRVARCFTDPVDCGSTTECTRFPDSYEARAAGRTT